MNVSISEIKQLFIINFHVNSIFDPPFRRPAGAMGKGSHEDALRSALMEDYNPNSLPNTFTNVSIRITVLHVDLVCQQ